MWRLFTLNNCFIGGINLSDEKVINKEIIRTKDDLFKMLDALMEQRESEWWNRFYSDREKEIPFFKNKPDENLVDYVENDYFTPGKILEIGCGPGRNARCVRL